MTGMSPEVVTQFETETWGRCAESYLDSFAVLTREAIPLLVEAARITSGSSVLDIGSGPGHLARELADRGAVVQGIDFAQPMVDAATRTYPDLRFQAANAEKLPFDAASFDAVVSNFVVHHLARPADVFKEVHRVLKPGGRFAFVVWGPPEEQSSIGVFFAAVQAHYDVSELPHGPLFGVTDRATYQPLITGAGLVDFHLENHKLEWRSKTFDSVLRGYSDWGNIAALPREIGDKILASAQENAKPFEKDGQYVFPHTVVLIHALKP